MNDGIGVDLVGDDSAAVVVRIVGAGGWLAATAIGFVTVRAPLRARLQAMRGHLP